MPTNDVWDSISTTINQKIDLLRTAGNLSRWKYCTMPARKITSPEQLNLVPAQEWKETVLALTWSSKDGEKWLIAKPEIPEVVHNIPTRGCSVYLDILMAIGATIFLNGKQVLHEDYWSDTRSVQLKLYEQFDPSGKFELTVRTNASDGFGYFGFAYVRVSSIEDVIFDLDLLNAQLKFTRFLAAQENNSELTRIWNVAVQKLNLEALSADDWAGWNNSVSAARKALDPFINLANTYTGHLIAHSHIDMNWLWPWQETVNVCRRDFTSMEKLLSKYEEFKFSQSQASTYDAMEVNNPEIFENIKKRIAEGRWEVTANTWVEGDLNMAAGEALIRQILYTQQYMQENFGVQPLICWEPDTFGHPATYPQILKKSGIKYYYFCRAGKQYPLFWWESPDGSRVFALQDLMGYGGDMKPSRVVDGLLNFYSSYDLKEGAYVYGVGDHGGAATAIDIECARKMRSSGLMPQTIPSRTSDFYNHAMIHANNVPVVKDELNTVFEGCYSTHSDIKRMNRQGENALFNAEASIALASVLAGAPAPDLTTAWRTQCLHQFHDILCGAAIGVTYDEASEKLGKVYSEVTHATSSAINAIANNLNTSRGAEKQLVIFNQLGWQRDDVVRIARNAFGTDSIPKSVIDENGVAYPVQVVGDEVIFIAKDIPAYGTRVYQLSQDNAENASKVGVCKVNNILENELLRIEVDRNSGALTKLLDKETGRDVGQPWLGWGPEAKVNAGVVNRMQILWEQPHPMSAWNIGDITHIDNLITDAEVRVVEEGPVCGVVEVRRKFLNSSLVQRIWLYDGLRRVDFQTVVDWHEKGSSTMDAPMLRATFTPLFGKTRATYETAFAGIERPADGLEKPALRWMDLSEENGDYGLSLLNDCKYGHSATGNTMGLTLVRASYEPDNNPDEGLHPFTYSLYPHSGTWKEAGTIQRAAELNQPLLYTFTGKHAGKHASNQPAFACESENVLISSVKLASVQPKNGKAVIVRLFESQGKAGKATIKTTFDLVSASETNLVEKPIKDLTILNGNHISLKLTPHEIVTICLILE